MASIELHQGDNRDSLRRLIDQGVRVHSVVCDPPYMLDSIVKRFGKAGAAPAKHGTDGAYARQSAGFMGQTWDGADKDGVYISFDPEFWALVYEILLPGGYVAAFSSPRTGHWQACAMEQAGFVMHPFLGWAYGQGFPKAHNAARAVDQALGHKGGKIATGEPVRRIRPGAEQNSDGTWEKLEDREYQPGTYVPASVEAGQWEGWAYGGQSLKPALEPIYLAQKPFSEKNGALNLLKHGVGAVNIDGCRVGVSPEDDIFAKNPETKGGFGHAGAQVYGASEGAPAYDPTKGRWPANLCHDGSDDVVAMFPVAPGQLARSSSSSTPRAGQNVYGEMKRGSEDLQHEPRTDSGSAARFFNAFPADPVFYCPKATKADRAGSRHPTVKPVALIEWLQTLLTPPGGITLDPFAGSGTSGEAARRGGFRSILMEQSLLYSADICRRFGFAAPASSAFGADVFAMLGCDDITQNGCDDIL